MKNLTSLLLLLLPFQMISQCWDYPAVDKLMETPRATFLHTPLGGLWWNSNDQINTIDDPNLSSTSTKVSFAGGFWYAAKDSNGEIYTRHSTYGSSNGSYSYSTGPITSDFPNSDICNLFNRIWEVDHTDIASFLDDWNENQQIDLPIPENIRGWPARGNTEIFSIYGVQLPDLDLAPFHDVNDNGIYDPLNGDYPNIKNAFTAQWWMFNDSGAFAPSQANTATIDISVLAFSLDDESATSTTFYYETKLTNRNNIEFEEMYLGLWVDPDLACFVDDNIGCSPENNLAYFFNAGEHIQYCLSGISSDYFDNAPPLFGIKILDGTDHWNGTDWEDNGMSSFTYYNNPNIDVTPPETQDPGSALQYWNMLKGQWKDGTPITISGDGYDPNSTDVTPFAFPDSPNDTEGWSMCTADLEADDRRMLIGSGPFTIPTQASQRFTFALLVTGPITDYPCPSIDPLITLSDEATEIYENLLVASGESRPTSDVLAVYPNPTSAILHIELGFENIQKLDVYDTAGKLIHQSANHGQQFMLNTKHFAPGLYALVIEDKSGYLYSHRFIKH